MRYTGLIILLVLCLTLLLLTGCIVNTVIPETAIGNLGNQEDINQSSNNSQNSSAGSVEEPVIENTEEPVMWSGLGMGLFLSDESYIDTMLANGFEQLRIDIPNYQATWLEQSKAVVITAISKGAEVIWGVSSNDFNNPDYTITAENWATYRQAILDNAQWAQDNGVFEFQLGNEEELHIDGTTMTVAQIITNLKSVATNVKAIFTRGNISYSCAVAFMDDWISEGKGDIDILACNIYCGGDDQYNDDWKTRITNLVNAFGVNGTYLTEFNLSGTSLEDYSTDEEVQATALTEMIDYIKASGITRALYFMWKDDGDAHYGVVKADETYRLLWNQALLNTGPVKSTTVLATAKPDTIALMPK